MEILLPTPWETRSLDVQSFMLNEELLGDLTQEVLARVLHETRIRFGRIFVSVRLAKSHHKITPLLQQQGFYFAEQTLDPFLALKKSPVVAGYLQSPLAVVPLRYRDQLPRIFTMDRNNPTHIDYVKQCARESFSDDRFHMDPNCTKQQADLRYFNWAGDLIASQEATVHIAETGQEMAGFLARKQEHLILAGFSQRYVGSGLGEFLWLGCLADMLKEGQTSAHTRISVNNVAVLNLYARLGFKFKNPASIFHYWG